MTTGTRAILAGGRGTTADRRDQRCGTATWSAALRSHMLSVVQRRRRRRGDSARQDRTSCPLLTARADQLFSAERPPTLTNWPSLITLLWTRRPTFTREQSGFYCRCPTNPTHAPWPLPLGFSPGSQVRQGGPGNLCSFRNTVMRPCNRATRFTPGLTSPPFRNVRKLKNVQNPKSPRGVLRLRRSDASRLLTGTIPRTNWNVFKTVRTRRTVRVQCVQRLVIDVEFFLFLSLVRNILCIEFKTQQYFFLTFIKTIIFQYIYVVQYNLLYIHLNMFDT